MHSHLCITVRFLDGSFHGRADRGEPEWPPSPLRLFQALVAAAAAHWNERGHIQQAAPALRWLEAQSEPTIIAPRGEPGAKYRLYVPDNIADLVARSWTRGNEASIADYRSEKDVRPTHLLDGDAVHYLWPLPAAQDEFLAQRDVLFATVGSITHLGWGVDMVTAHAVVLTQEEAAALPGRRWQTSPGNADATPLRIPVAGTLADLESKHAAFLNRTSGGRFSPVPPLSRFALAGYADSAAPPRAPTAAFSLLRADASGFRIYDPVRDGMRVAGMLRHAAGDPQIAAALGWDDEKMRRVVHGHSETPGDAHRPANGPRVAFLPLPSLAYSPGFKVGDIRRVLLAGVQGQSREELLAIARLLSGQVLIPEAADGSGEPDALLSRLPDSDRQVGAYTGRSAVWTTVTPLILPGHDDRSGYRQRLFPKPTSDRPTLTSAQQQEFLHKLDTRTDSLLRKSIRQAGFSEELAAHAELAWRNVGFCPGLALASLYAVPQKLRRFRRLHVRIAWKDAGGNPVQLPGPLSLGGGRFMGLGLFCPLLPVRDGSPSRP